MFIFHFKTILGSIRSLWGSMGSLWGSMGYYGVLWGTMGFYGVKRRTGERENKNKVIVKISFQHDCCPIHVASQGKPEIVRMLLDNGANINVKDVVSFSTYRGSRNFCLNWIKF